MLNISAVSYLNTFPFVYGLRKSGFLNNHQLDLQVPSLCAKKLISGESDIALVPVGALPEIGKVTFLTDYCIGATGPVKTVLLLSHVPLNEISAIYLDFDSRTSVELVKVLAENYWKINPEWIRLESGASNKGVLFESMVAIGDKTFYLRKNYAFVYDLAAEWVNFSGLPFVFAIWAAKKVISQTDLSLFNQALTYGVNHITECIEYFKGSLPACDDCLGYLENSISYSFDADKKLGLQKFLSFL
jgi:chorismate dehydratase